VYRDGDDLDLEQRSALNCSVWDDIRSERENRVDADISLHQVWEAKGIRYPCSLHHQSDDQEFIPPPEYDRKIEKESC